MDLNYSTYDSLAEDYFEQLTKYDNCYKIGSEKICNMIFDYLYTHNQNDQPNTLNVLELGCGPGAILQTLKSNSKVKTYAIDFSENGGFAHISNAQTKISIINVLDIDNLNKCFGECICSEIDIIMAAFIHLFPLTDAKIILRKTKDWLSPNGIVYVDTTKEPVFRDGDIMIKS